MLGRAARLLAPEISEAYAVEASSVCRPLATEAASVEIDRWSAHDGCGLLDDAVASGRPVLLSHIMETWDLAAHSFASLNRQFRDRQVLVEASSGGADYRDLYRDSPIPGREFQADVQVSLGQLLDHIAARESQQGPEDRGSVTLYLAQKDVRSALPELAIDPGSLPIKAAAARLFQQSLWLGPKGTVTPLHCDPYYNLFCQVWGSKRLCIFTPEEKLRLRPFPAGPLRNTSQVDIGSAELDSVPSASCILGPGDVLYLPRRFWHSVTALSGSLSMSFWWT